MLHFATPWDVSRTRRDTLVFHAMKLDGSMSNRPWNMTASGKTMKCYIARTRIPNFTIIKKRWDLFQKIIFTQYKQTQRVRAQVLALKVTRGELERVIESKNRFTERIDQNALRLEIGGPDREIWLWPVAIRAPMAPPRTLEESWSKITRPLTSWIQAWATRWEVAFTARCSTTSRESLSKDWDQVEEEIASTTSLCHLHPGMKDQRPSYDSRGRRKEQWSTSTSPTTHFHSLEPEDRLMAISLCNKPFPLHRLTRSGTKTPSMVNSTDCLWTKGRNNWYCRSEAPRRLPR